jgi:hypothetical protein
MGPVKPAAQTFTLQIGQAVEPGEIGGVPVEGAGNLETGSSRDVDTMAVGGDSATVIFDGQTDFHSSGPRYGSHTIEVATGHDFGPVVGHHEYQLPGGDYRIEVERPGVAATYTFTSFLKPDPQTFPYQIG